MKYYRLIRKILNLLAKCVERYPNRSLCAAARRCCVQSRDSIPVRSTHSDYGGEIQRKWKQEGESKLNKSGRAKRRHFCSVLIRLPASTYAEFPRTDRRLLCPSIPVPPVPARRLILPAPLLSRRQHAATISRCRDNLPRQQKSCRGTCRGNLPRRQVVKSLYIV